MSEKSLRDSGGLASTPTLKILILPNGSRIPGLYSGQAGHTHGSQKGGSGDPMAPAEERSRYPSILRLRQLLQEVHRGIFAHHPPTYQTAQDEQ